MQKRVYTDTTLGRRAVTQHRPIVTVEIYFFTAAVGSSVSVFQPDLQAIPQVSAMRKLTT